ncbi:MAG: hypothetical protein J3R72DRAFT_496303 [Linnemannia gamsii]|nr:MAG: hypothetical protein J3R72DRAFT_496303 [Linnemannia gamsii]
MVLLTLISMMIMTSISATTRNYNTAIPALSTSTPSSNSTMTTTSSSISSARYLSSIAALSSISTITTIRISIFSWTSFSFRPSPYVSLSFLSSITTMEIIAIVVLHLLVRRIRQFGSAYDNNWNFQVKVFSEVLGNMNGEAGELLG